MHVSVLVMIHPQHLQRRANDLAKTIEDLMLPHREVYDEESEETRGYWDWYQIGGRWTGHFDGYDPEQDPQNVETCPLCVGTGDRPDTNQPGCNGCGGKGQRSKWPTDWALHTGDLTTVRALQALKESDRPEPTFACVSPGGEWSEQGWGIEGSPERPEWGKRFWATFIEPADPTVLCVIVDCHC